MKVAGNIGGSLLSLGSKEKKNFKKITASVTRKVEKAGGEQQLHETYVCREAKNLLKQGVSVERIREILEADMSLVTKELDDKLLEMVMAEVQSTRVRRINNIVSTSKTLSTRTDPQVKQYIKHITNNE